MKVFSRGGVREHAFDMLKLQGAAPTARPRVGRVRALRLPHDLLPQGLLPGKVGVTRKRLLLFAHGDREGGLRKDRGRHRALVRPAKEPVETIGRVLRQKLRDAKRELIALRPAFALEKARETRETPDEFVVREPSPHHPVENAPRHAVGRRRIPFERLEEIVRRKELDARADPLRFGEELREARRHGFGRNQNAVLGKERRKIARPAAVLGVPLEIRAQDLPQDFKGVRIIGVNHVGFRFGRERGLFVSAF